MRGYVQNEGTQAYFIVQRQIPPGGKVKIEDIYKSVGKKSGLEEGIEFVEWLRTNVFRKGSWKFYEEEGKLLGPSRPKDSPKVEVKKEVAPNSKTSSNRADDAVGAGRVLRRDSKNQKGTEITAASIIEAPYDKARTLIDKTRDKSVLNKAMALTKHFSGKEQHMRHLMRRLEQV